MKDTMHVELPLPLDLPNGSTATDATVRMLTIKERMDLAKKYQGNALLFTFEALKLRLVRLGDLSAPVDKAVIESLPAPIFDELNEATLGLDLGFDSLDAFRASDKYDGFRQG